MIFVTTRRARGFTLVEVLIALFIVVMAATALVGTLTSSMSNTSYLRDKTTAEWVAMNQLTTIRISQQMPDPGKRTGYVNMAGMRWQWEQEVTELPVVKGLFRVDVRARSTGEAVDDSKPQDEPTAQKDPDSQPSGSDTDKLSWTTTVTGVISTARSDLRSAIAYPMRGQKAGANNGNPDSPGEGHPGTPNPPGTPGMPGAPRGAPVPPKPLPSPSDR